MDKIFNDEVNKAKFKRSAIDSSRKALSIDKSKKRSGKIKKDDDSSVTSEDKKEEKENTSEDEKEKENKYRLMIQRNNMKEDVSIRKKYKRKKLQKIKEEEKEESESEGEAEESKKDQSSEEKEKEDSIPKISQGLDIIEKIFKNPNFNKTKETIFKFFSDKFGKKKEENKMKGFKIPKKEKGERKEEEKIPKETINQTLKSKLPDKDVSLKEIVDKKREEEIENVKNQEEEEVEEDEDSGFEDPLKVFDKDEEKLILQNIIDRVNKLAKSRLAGVPFKNPVFWDNPKEKEIFLKYLDAMADDDIVLNIENIYVPPSKSTVNGTLYEIPGFVLSEISEDSHEIQKFLHTLAKKGFEIPSRLVQWCINTKPYHFTTILETHPFLFQDFGSPVGPLAVLTKPSMFKDLGVLTDSRVSLLNLAKMLGVYEKEFKSSSILDEIRSLYYIDADAVHLERVSPNTETVLEYYKRAIKKCDDFKTENKVEIEKACENPKEYFSQYIPHLTVFSDKEEIALINEKQHVKRMDMIEVAKTIKTSFTMEGPDLSMIYVMANFTQSVIPKKILKIMEEFYTGTGGIKMLGERYAKSLQIYKKANSPENKEFHRKWYAKNFSKMLEEFGYIYGGKKHGIPKDADDYISMINANGSKLNHINPHAKGTYTSFKKRVNTGFSEIEAGLKHWKNIEEKGDNKSFQFFYIGFKNICAKLKDEIHSYKKPPRFYNPTFIAAFIPFQYVLNLVFDQCPPNSEKCPYSLLGIKDTDTTFSKLMDKISTVPYTKYHYSDNFWIKEENYYVSVDVQRCDSNLSKEALFYPLITFGRMVLDDESYKKYEILCNLFVQCIPRGTLFSFVNKLFNKKMKEEMNKGYNRRGRPLFKGMKVVEKINEEEMEEFERKKDEYNENYEINFINKFITLMMPFYWLPSGVVGTAYINHMFTAAFLYYTKDTNWIDGENKDLTLEIKKKADTFGIKLEIASFVDFNKVQKGDFVKFDLLGRSGYYTGSRFIPVLEEERVWKTLMFIKKKKYDINSAVGSFIRLAKLDSLVQLGGLMYPVAREVIFSGLVAYSSFLRKNLISLTREQATALIETLDSFNIDPVSYEGFIFKGFIPSINQYIKSKTGIEISVPEFDEFDRKIGKKFDQYYTVWAALLPVIQGVDTSKTYFDHLQYTKKPYWVAPYFTELIKSRREDKKFTFHSLGRELMKIYGQSLGGSIYLNLLQLIQDYGDSVLKKIKRKFKKAGKEVGEKWIKKGSNKTQVNNTIKDLIEAFFSKQFKVKEIFEFVIEENKQKKEYIYAIPKKEKFKGLEQILNRVELQDIMDKDNNDFWYLLQKGDLGRRFNYVMSKIMFDGIPPKRIFENKMGASGLGAFSNYRELPFKIESQIYLNPERLRMENNKMILNNVKPVLNDLGLLTGTLSNPAKNVYPLDDIKNIKKGEKDETDEEEEEQSEEVKEIKNQIIDAEEERKEKKKVKEMRRNVKIKEKGKVKKEKDKKENDDDEISGKGGRKDKRKK